MRKRTKPLKFLVTLLCFVSMLGNAVTVGAEDRPLPVTPVILKLEGTPPLTIQATIGTSTKYLWLGTEDRGSSIMRAPFGKILEFPVTDVMYSNSSMGVWPSTYILQNLTENFREFEWSLEDYPKLQLPEYPGYVLHVGDAIGQPDRARWMIRKTGKGAYEEYPVEHVLEYRNTKGNWVRAFTRRMNWAEPAGGVQTWGYAETKDQDNVYWELIQNPDVENISPAINGVLPEKPMRMNENNTGTIAGTHIFREGKLGSQPDLLSGVEVVGAVTGATLSLTDMSPIPDRHFRIAHNMAGISHLLTGDTYTAVGRGNVVSVVTDYENDKTIFTQEIIVSTTGKPGINIYLAGTEIEYQMQWMSNNPSADEERRRGLDLQADSTINGTYDLATVVEGTEQSYSNVTKDDSEELVKNAKILGWKNIDTTEKGISVTSIAYLTGSRSTTMSAESDAKYMRFDSTVPTITKVQFEDDNWEQVIGTDAYDGLSELETKSGGVFYKFVARDATTGMEIPTDSSAEWASLRSYELPKEVGEYDLYVYAKDNATNRSKVLLVNGEPIVVSENLSAKVRLEKKVTDDKGNNKDTFLLHIKEDDTILGSAILKCNEASDWMSLVVEEGKTRTIEVFEVVPMDYKKDYRISITDADKNTTVLDKGETKIKLKQGDEITITIENTFSHAGYFRAKDNVKNIFSK